MSRRFRVSLIALVVAYIPGTPGLGVDTRTGGPDYLAIAYGVAFLAPLLALAASWKWPILAAWLALLSGIFAIVLPGLDEVGLLAGPPPSGMIALNALLVVLGAVITGGALRTVRRR